MTAKRWEIIDEEFISYTGGTAQLISNGECKIHLWELPKDAQLFCDKLNAINEENEELKEENKGVKDVLINLKKIDSFWDSALLQEHIDKIANILGVELE